MSDDSTIGTEAPGWLAPAMVAITLVLWASAFVVIRHLGATFGPGALSLGRLLVGSVALGVAVLGQRRHAHDPGSTPVTWREWRSMALIGVLWFGVYNLALNAGERRIDAGTAALLIQLSPILIAVLAVVVLRDHPTRFLALGIALAFAGVALIALSTSLEHPTGGGHDLLGVLLCLLSAVVYSVSLVLQKPLLARRSALLVTWVACTVGAVVCLPFAGSLVSGLREAAPADVGWLVYLGVFPTAVAFTTFAVALRRTSASRLGVTTYLVPPITVLLSWGFLSETPPVVAYVGGAMCLLGVAVARRQPPAHHPPSGTARLTVEREV